MRRACGHWFHELLHKIYLMVPTFLAILRVQSGVLEYQKSTRMVWTRPRSHTSMGSMDGMGDGVLARRVECASGEVSGGGEWWLGSVGGLSGWGGGWARWVGVERSSFSSAGGAPRPLALGAFRVAKFSGGHQWS